MLYLAIVKHLFDTSHEPLDIKFLEVRRQVRRQPSHRLTVGDLVPNRRHHLQGIRGTTAIMRAVYDDENWAVVQFTSDISEISRWATIIWYFNFNFLP
jgi:hypothetical protein